MTKVPDSPQGKQASGSVTDRLKAALRALREDNLEPSAIVVAPSFQFLNFKMVEFDAAEFGAGTSPPADAPEAAAANFLGRIEGVPVFRSLNVADDRACVIDVARFATWRQWKVRSDGDLLSIEMRDFSEEEALDLARERPDLWPGAQQQSEEDRAAQIRARALLRLRERFEIRIDNQSAAVWVDISEEST